MRRTVFALAVALSLGGFNVYAQSVEMPDHSTWTMELDHKEPYMLGTERVDVRDQHYVFINQKQTERQIVVVFYHPKTNEPWFALYVRQYRDPQKDAEAYLFDRKDNKWVFAQDISKVESLDEILKNSYGLVFAGQ